MNDVTAGELYRTLVAIRALYGKRVTRTAEATEAELESVVLKKTDTLIEECATLFAEQPADMKIPLPKCPSCAMDPMKFVVVGVQIPPGMICRVIACAGCRNALNVQIISAKPQVDIPQGAPGTGIWVPGMPKL